VVQNGSWQKVAGKSWRDLNFRQGENEPVVCVSWDDSQAYIEWLNRETGKKYRLPTEAEWEYAARGGTTASRYWGENPDQACGYANVADQSAKRKNSGWTVHDCDDGYAETAPVGSFKPNGFGLHDMLGNVWEWNQDRWHEDYKGAPNDGGAWETGGSSIRVFRGGSWSLNPWFCRSAYRNGLDPDYRIDYLGFRLALSGHQ
jgi:formylglycine-generating enzyme required for sulfatase activity